MLELLNPLFINTSIGYWSVKILCVCVFFLLKGKADVVFILADLVESYADTEHSFLELERLTHLLGGTAF